MLRFNVGDGRASEGTIELNGTSGSDVSFGAGETGRQDLDSFKKIWIGDAGRVKSGDLSKEDRIAESLAAGGNGRVQSSELKTVFGNKLDAEDIFDIISIQLGLEGSSYKKGGRAINSEDGIDGINIVINGDASVTLEFDGRAKNGQTDDLTVTGSAVEALLDEYVLLQASAAAKSGGVAGSLNTSNKGDQTKIMSFTDLADAPNAQILSGVDKYTVDGANENKFSNFKAKDITADLLGKDPETGTGGPDGVNLDALDDYDQVTRLVNEAEGIVLYEFDNNSTDTLIITTPVGSLGDPELADGVAGVRASNGAVSNSIKADDTVEQTLKISEAALKSTLAGKKVIFNTDDYTNPDGGSKGPGFLKGKDFDQFVFQTTGDPAKSYVEITEVDTVETVFGTVSEFNFDGPVDDTVLVYETEAALVLYEELLG